MNTSLEVDKLVESLSSAKSGFKPIAKNKTGNTGARDYKYADLPDILDAINSALNFNGLCVSQSPNFKEGRLIVLTRLFHKSGQWIENEVSLKASQDTPQGMGSAITYGRRYGLTALLGICADDDDDGQSAQPQQSEKKYEQRKQEFKKEEPSKPKEAPQRNVASEVYKMNDTLHLGFIKKWSEDLQIGLEDLRTLEMQFSEKTLKEIYELMNVWAKG